MTKDQSTHHREQARAGVYARAHEIARRNYPALTESQSATLASKIADHPAFATFVDSGELDPGDDWVKAEIAAWETLAPALFRPCPTPAELARVLIAKLSEGAHPTEKINISRRVERMSADERLAASEGLDMTARAPEPTASKKPGDLSSATASELDDALNARGIDPRSLLPSKRREYHDEIKREGASPATPAIAECRAKLALGKTFADINPTTRMRAQREAHAAGTTLKELGVS